MKKTRLDHVVPARRGETPPIRKKKAPVETGARFV
jgi:hypothetical protein